MREQCLEADTSQLKQERWSLGILSFGIARLAAQRDHPQRVPNLDGSAAMLFYQGILQDSPRDRSSLISLARAQLLFRLYSSAWSTFSTAYSVQRGLFSLTNESQSSAVLQSDLVSTFKLDHDMEQLQYLNRIGVMNAKKTEHIISILGKARLDLQSYLSVANESKIWRITGENIQGVIPYGVIEGDSERSITSTE